jgi:hypothetical protein
MWIKFKDSLQETRPPEALQTVTPQTDFLEEGKFHYQIEVFLHLVFSNKIHHFYRFSMSV